MTPSPFAPVPATSTSTAIRSPVATSSFPVSMTGAAAAVYDGELGGVDADFGGEHVGGLGDVPDLDGGQAARAETVVT